MKKELEKILVENFPDLFTHYRNKKKGLYGIYYGVETGDGWFSLIDATLALIQKEINTFPDGIKQEFVIHQIKEKFGSLRIHLNDYNPAIQSIIQQAYEKSLETCVWCGATKGVTQNEDRFVRSMCPSCMSKFAEQDYHMNDEF